MAARHASAMPRTGAPPMIGDTPTTVLARTASAIAGTARMAPMLTTGLEGGNRTTSAAAIASSTPGAGRARAAPSTMMSAAGTSACSRTHHSWKCTVRRDPGSPRPGGWPGPGGWAPPWLARAGGQDHVRLGPVVRHRDQRHPGLPALAQRRGGRGQGLAGRQHAGPDDVRGEVLVTQVEPVRPGPAGAGAVGAQLGEDGERVGVAAPALLLADPAAQRVHHGVQVR